MAGLNYELALRIEKKMYYVNGTTIDDHGDAHAEDRFSKVIRKAEDVGEIEGENLSYLRLDYCH